VIHAKHREAPLRNGAPNDGNGNAEHGLTVRPGAGKLSSDARVVYEIVLRFIPPDGEPTEPKRCNPNWLLSTHTDQDGAAIFQQACKMGLEGIVWKRLRAPYRSPLAQGEEPREPGDDQGAESGAVNSGR
jgi:hypothetical protein